VHKHSQEHEFNVRVIEVSFSHERICTKTSFEEESKIHSEKVEEAVGDSRALRPIILLSNNRVQN